MSEDYFVDRQDRYMVIKNCKELCNFYECLFDSISEFSFKLDSKEKFVFNHHNSQNHPYLGNYRLFSRNLSRSILDTFHKYNNYIKNPIREEEEKLIDIESMSKNKALIIPLVQYGDFNVKMDEIFTNSLILKAPSNSEIALAVGYFNLTNNYKKSILKSRADFRVITASPMANGFFGSKGFTKNIPDIYRYLELRFLNLIERRQENHRIQFFEYFRKDWSNLNYKINQN